MEEFKVIIIHFFFKSWTRGSFSFRLGAQLTLRRSQYIIEEKPILCLNVLSTCVFVCTYVMYICTPVVCVYYLHVAVSFNVYTSSRMRTYTEYFSFSRHVSAPHFKLWRNTLYLFLFFPPWPCSVLRHAICLAPDVFKRRQAGGPSCSAIQSS